MTLTYLQFHVLFVLPALAAVAVAARRQWAARLPDWPAVGGHDGRAVGTAVVTLLALVYTTPWDNYLIARGAWGYGDGAVELTLWYAPLGEYLFFVAQPVLTALWLFRLPIDPAAPVDVRVTVAQRGLGLAGGVAIAVAGWWLLADPAGLYLGALLVWAGPVLALQWAVGWPYLWTHRRQVALAVAVPTGYLWLVDRVALAAGVWYLSPTHTTGLVVPVLGLPVEEAVFFLLTNLFVVQGLVLFRWVSARWL